MSDERDPNTYKNQLRNMYKSVIAAKADWKSQRFSGE